MNSKRLEELILLELTDGNGNTLEVNNSVLLDLYPN